MGEAYGEPLIDKPVINISFIGNRVRLEFSEFFSRRRFYFILLSSTTNFDEKNWRFERKFEKDLKRKKRMMDDFDERNDRGRES